MQYVSNVCTNIKGYVFYNYNNNIQKPIFGWIQEDSLYVLSVGILLFHWHFTVNVGTASAVGAVMSLPKEGNASHQLPSDFTTVRAAIHDTKCNSNERFPLNGGSLSKQAQIRKILYKFLSNLFHHSTLGTYELFKFDNKYSVQFIM